MTFGGWLSKLNATCDHKNRSSFSNISACVSTGRAGRPGTTGCCWTSGSTRRTCKDEIVSLICLSKVAKICKNKLVSHDDNFENTLICLKKIKNMEKWTACLMMMLLTGWRWERWIWRLGAWWKKGKSTETELRLNMSILFYWNWVNDCFIFFFGPLQGDDGFPGYPGQKVILSMKIGLVPLIRCCLFIYFSSNSSGRSWWTRP